MIRVAFVEQESQMGGVEYSTLILASALDRKRFQPVVIVPEHGPLVEHCQSRNISVLLAPRPTFRSASWRIAGRTVADPLAMLLNPLRLERASAMLAQVLRAFSPDLVITKGLLVHFYGGLAARRLRVPCLWHVQDEVPPERARGLYLRTLQLAGQVLAASVVGDAASIAAQFPAHPAVTTVYNGIDTDEYAPGTVAGTLRHDLGIPTDAILIGNLARLTDWKGQHVLIEAFNVIAQHFPMAHLVLIGSPLFDNDQYEQRLRLMAAIGAGAGRIHFAGYRTDTAASLAALDLYVHPSLRKDTAPLALLSALSTGLPTIISAVPGMLEVVEPGVSALTTPSGDSQVLAEQLSLLLSQPELGKRLGQAARTSAVARFSISVHTTQMQAMIESALTNVSASSHHRG
ncbi:MAG: glycosyltransferase family 4 protein [Oscillochloridaceae bacterium umkhey_bin13]